MSSYTFVNVANTSGALAFGSGTTTTINVTAPSAARTYTVPDAGTDTSFWTADGSQTVNGQITYSTNPVQLVNTGSSNYTFCRALVASFALSAEKKTDQESAMPVPVPRRSPLSDA